MTSPPEQTVPVQLHREPGLLVLAALMAGLDPHDISMRLHHDRVPIRGDEKLRTVTQDSKADTFPRSIPNWKPIGVRAPIAEMMQRSLHLTKSGKFGQWALKALSIFFSVHSEKGPHQHE